MKVDINGKEYLFQISGFAPFYAYEVIEGEPFQGGTTRSGHVLMYATLLTNNVGVEKPSMAEFVAWLYENPAQEEALAKMISDELKRRAELLGAGKKKE